MLEEKCPLIASSRLERLTQLTNAWNSGLILPGVFGQNANNNPALVLFLYTLCVMIVMMLTTELIAAHMRLRMNPVRKMLFDLLLTSLNAVMGLIIFQKAPLTMMTQRAITAFVATLIMLRMMNQIMCEETQLEDEFEVRISFFDAQASAPPEVVVHRIKQARDAEVSVSFFSAPASTPAEVVVDRIDDERNLLPPTLG